MRDVVVVEPLREADLIVEHNGWDDSVEDRDHDPYWRLEDALITCIQMERHNQANQGHGGIELNESEIAIITHQDHKK